MSNHQKAKSKPNPQPTKKTTKKVPPSKRVPVIPKPRKNYMPIVPQPGGNNQANNISSQVPSDYIPVVPQPMGSRCSARIKAKKKLKGSIGTNSDCDTNAMEESN